MAREIKKGCIVHGFASLDGTLPFDPKTIEERKAARRAFLYSFDWSKVKRNKSAKSRHI